MVYIIIVNWNGWGDTIECLESVFRSDYPDFRVIVCDNGSGDDSLRNIKAWAERRLAVWTAREQPLRTQSPSSSVMPLPYAEYSREEAESGGEQEPSTPLVLINNGRNLGFAGGNNVGLRYALARGDFGYAWLLNNDTIVESDALTELVKRMEEKVGAGMCGSTLLLYDKPHKVQALGGGWYCKWIGLPWHRGRFGKWPSSVNQMKAEAGMNYVEGASMLVSRAFLLEIGLMCEDYFLYFEETDWAIRAHGHYALCYADASLVYHKVGRSIGTTSNPLNKSDICDYYNVRNRLLFTSRYFRHALPSIILMVVLEIFLRATLLRPARSWMLAGILWNFIVCPGKFNADFKRIFDDGR